MRLVSILLLSTVLVGCYGDGKKPDDGTVIHNISTEAEMAIRVYADRLADAHLEIAERVRNGEFSNGDKVNERSIAKAIGDLTERARVDAFKPMKKATGDAGGLGKPNVNEEIAKGFRKAAK